MELNRNQYFMIGLVILFLGIQAKFVNAYVLTEDAATFVAKRLDKAKSSSENSSTMAQSLTAVAGVSPSAKQRTVKPPTWVGWALISVGAVLILHSFAMGRPS